MDRETIGERLTEAQSEVVRNRHYLVEHAALSETAAALESELAYVLDGFSDLFVGLPRIPDCYHTPPIALQKVETQPATDSEGERPAGVVEVTFLPLRRNPSKDHWAPWRGSPGSVLPERDRLGFALSYNFTADGDDRTAHMGEESTVWQSEARQDKEDEEPYEWGSTLYSGRVAVPSLLSFGDEAEARLARYRDEYLPARTKQIQQLRSSLELIQAALEDEELNPWYQEHLANIRREREEAQLLAEQQAEEARRPAETSRAEEPPIAPRRRFAALSRRSH